MRVAIWLLMIAACSSSNRCPAPPGEIISCEPLSPGSIGCVGLCDGACLPQDDAGFPYEQTYPVGCKITLPYCSPAFPGEAEICVCLQIGGGSPQWDEPI